VYQGGEKITLKVKFKRWDCVTSQMYYSNGRRAILLVDDVPGAPVAKATINMPEATLEDDEVIIKDYAENEGMTAALVEAGVIEPENQGMITAGRCTVPIHKLTPEYLEEVSDDT
jgi:hypothetical protein